MKKWNCFYTLDGKDVYTTVNAATKADAMLQVFRTYGTKAGRIVVKSY